MSRGTVGFHGLRLARLAREVGLATLVALAGALAGGCADRGGPDALPTLVDVWVMLPHGYDQALLIGFDRPVRGLEAAPGLRQFADADAAVRAVLVIADAPLPPGQVRIGTFRAPDAATAGSFGAMVLDAARSDYAPREDLSGYSVRLDFR